MPTMLDYKLPEQRHTTLVLQGSLIVLRLFVATSIFWMVHHLSTSSSPHQSMLLIGLLIYASSSVLLGLAAIKSAASSMAKTCHGLDVVLSMWLLWILPDHAMLGFSIPLVLFSAALVGYRAFGLVLFAALLLGVALFSAYWHQILSSSMPMPIHILQGILSLIALLVSFRLQQPQILSGSHATDPQSGLPYFSVLKEGFVYLLPYHQRNRIPLSLMMIRLPEKSMIQTETLQAVCAYVAQRLRKSDLMVRYDERHLAILLCDTSDHGGFLLAQALQQYLRTDNLAPALHYAVLRVPLENSILDVLLQKMQDALILASQHETDRVVFVSND